VRITKAIKKPPQIHRFQLPRQGKKSVRSSKDEKKKPTMKREHKPEEKASPMREEMGEENPRRSFRSRTDLAGQMKGKKKMPYRKSQLDAERAPREKRGAFNTRKKCSWKETCTAMEEYRRSTTQKNKQTLNGFNSKRVTFSTSSGEERPDL